MLILTPSPATDKLDWQWRRGQSAFISRFTHISKCILLANVGGLGGSCDEAGNHYIHLGSERYNSIAFMGILACGLFKWLTSTKSVFGIKKRKQTHKLKRSPAIEFSVMWVWKLVKLTVPKYKDTPDHTNTSNHCNVWCCWCLVWFIFASLWCSLCYWKAEVDIPALSVKSLLHLDLGSQGCPGPARYHLNHTLISLPCTLCCWVNNVISVKQLLPPPAASPLTLCLSLSLLLVCAL